MNWNRIISRKKQNNSEFESDYSEQNNKKKKKQFPTQLIRFLSYFFRDNNIESIEEISNYRNLSWQKNITELIDFQITDNLKKIQAKKYKKKVLE